MIKINDKNVTKMLIDGKEVEKVVVNGNTVWPANLGPTAPEWFPEYIQPAASLILTSTATFNIIAANLGTALAFIIPALGYGTIFQNGSQLGSYYMSMGIYDTRKERLWIISTDSNNAGKAKCVYYDNITSVQLPGLSSSNQSRYGQHRIIYYDISQYAPSNNFKIELINSCCDNTVNTNGVDVPCYLNNNSQTYHIGLFDGYVSGVPYYSNCSLFALSNYTNNANYSKYATSTGLASYNQLGYPGNIVTHLYGYSDGIADYIKGHRYRYNDNNAPGGTSINQQVTLSDLEAYSYLNNTIINKVYQYQYGTTAIIKVTWDID